MSLNNDKILPHLEQKLDYALKTETFWSNTSLISWVLSTVVLAAGGIFAFSSSTYPDLPFGFISGILIVIGTTFKDFVYFATNLDHIKETQINNIMKNLGINFKITGDSALVNEILHNQKNINNSYKGVESSTFLNIQPSEKSNI